MKIVQNGENYAHCAVKDNETGLFMCLFEIFLLVLFTFSFMFWKEVLWIEDIFFLKYLHVRTNSQ